MQQAFLSFSISWSLLKLMSIELLTVSSSAAPFFFYPQFFPVSGSFPMSWLFASGGQSTRVSDSASVLPMNIQGWFPLELTGLISSLSKGLSRVFSSTTILKASILQCSAFFILQLPYLYMTTGKTTQAFVSKVTSLLFNMLPRFFIAFLPMSKHIKPESP